MLVVCRLLLLLVELLLLLFLSSLRLSTACIIKRLISSSAFSAIVDDSAFSRAFLLILRPRFSEPAIDVYFSKQVLCENKYYNLVLFFKRVIFFL